jgi:hypothetical protein
MVIVVSIISISETRLSSAEDSKEISEARLLTDTIATNIESIYYGLDGHSDEIVLPPDVSGYNYQIKVNKSGVFLQIGGYKCYSSFFSCKITDNSLKEKDIFMYPQRKYNFSNYRDSTGNYWIIIKQV